MIGGLGLKGSSAIHDLLSEAECADLIALCEQQGFEIAEQKETRDTAMRRNGRIQVVSDMLAARLWRRLTAH